MITLSIAMPFNDELEEECQFLNVDDGKVPPSVVRYAAMQGVSLTHHKLTRAKYDWGTMHFTFEPVSEGDFVTLPQIPYTDDNYHPLHGPAQRWWVALCRMGIEGPNILEPEVVEEVKAALGGLDLTGKEVIYVTKAMNGYQIRIRRDVLNAPVLIGFDKAAEGQDISVETKQVKCTENVDRKQVDANAGGQSMLGRALDSALDALTIGSLLD